MSSVSFSTRQRSLQLDELSSGMFFYRTAFPSAGRVQRSLQLEGGFFLVCLHLILKSRFVAPFAEGFASPFLT